MARRLAFAVLFSFGMLISTGTAIAESGCDTAQQTYRTKVAILGAIAGVELLLIISLLRSRSRSRAAEGALRQSEQELRKSEEDASTARAEFSGRLIQAQEKERTRIARELHDDINQRMALLANGIERVMHVNGDYTKAEQTKELRELWQLTDEIATDIQHLSHQLHPSKLHYLGLATAARDLCQGFSRQYRIGVDCNVHGLPANLGEEVSLSLFRVLQESLRNVAKHSHASHVEVALIHGSGVVKLRVSDDGVGFDPNRPQNPLGLGLVSMGERLRSVGGQFGVSSRPGSGTQVEVTVPATLKQSRAAYSPAE